MGKGARAGGRACLGLNAPRHGRTVGRQPVRSQSRKQGIIDSQLANDLDDIRAARRGARVLGVA
jgi:hypothetical protein